MAELLTDSQKSLDEAIVKAMKAGWEPTYNGLEIKGREVGPSDITWIATNGHKVYEDAYHLIFNHDFAEALWGEEVYATDGSTSRPILFKWQDKLINMVIADDPIKYLGENI